MSPASQISTINLAIDIVIITKRDDGQNYQNKTPAVINQNYPFTNMPH